MARAFSQDLDQLDPLEVVPHLTVAGFINKCPHRFHFEEIIRFGDKVGKAAEALHLSYETTIDLSLGRVRIFPVPLMIRVYKVMAGQFGWEPYVDSVDALPEAAPAAVKTEKARKTLEAMLEHINDPSVAAAFTTVIHSLETQGATLPPGNVRPMNPAN